MSFFNKFIEKEYILFVESSTERLDNLGKLVYRNRPLPGVPNGHIKIKFCTMLTKSHKFGRRVVNY